MLRFVVEIDWILFWLVTVLGLVMGSLYAAVLSTRGGRAVCARRTHWTVVGGHLLMALTMCFVSPAVAGLWLLWSAVHGFPLMVRSELLRWRGEREVSATLLAAIRGLLKGQSWRLYEAGEDRGSGNGHGDSGAGVGGSG